MSALGNHRLFSPEVQSPITQTTEDVSSIGFADPDSPDSQPIDHEAAVAAPAKPAATGKKSRTAQKKSEPVVEAPKENKGGGKKPSATIKTAKPPEKQELPQFADPGDEEVVEDDELESSLEVDDDEQLEFDDDDAASNVDDGEFDKTILHHAQRHGISAEEAKEYGSPDVLRRVLTRLDQQQSAWAQQQIDAKRGQAPPEQKPAEKPSDKEPPKAPTETGATVLKLNLDPEVMSDETVAALREVETQVNQAIGPLLSELNQLRAAQQQSVSDQAQAKQRQTDIELDRFFDSLGEDYHDVFGKGSLRSLPENSPAVAERFKLVKAVDTLMYADTSRGIPLDDVSEYCRRALAMTHSGKSLQLERRKLKDEVGKRRRNATAQTTSRSTGSLTPTQIAMKNADRRWREKNTQSQQDDERDSLL